MLRGGSFMSRKVAATRKSSMVLRMTVLRPGTQAATVSSLAQLQAELAKMDSIIREKQACLLARHRLACMLCETPIVSHKRAVRFHCSAILCQGLIRHAKASLIRNDATIEQLLAQVVQVVRL